MRPSMASMSSVRTLLVATPSCDVYGSDLQMLETVRAVRDEGWRVVVTAPATGPLEERLVALGAEFRKVEVPVLRRAAATPVGMLRLALAALIALRPMLRLLHEVRPDVVLVNTITLPVWTVTARLARRTTVVHVHEAEEADRRLVRKAMSLPLRFAHTAVMNSRTTLESLCAVSPALRGRSVVIYNGVEPPETEPEPKQRHGTVRLAVVGRLSPRKAPDVALEAAGILRRAGRDVEIELVGTPVAGAEAFRDELVERSHRDDLDGSVIFAGYTSPIWSALQRADVVVAPSLGESFGNAVVEAQLASRPVVATAVQGHLETITDGETGLHVPPSDAQAIATAVVRLLDDPPLADRLAQRARTVALEKFVAARYRSEMRDLMNRLAATGGRSRH